MANRSHQGKRISPEEAPALCCGSFFTLMSKQTSEDCWASCPPHCPCSPQTSHHLAYSKTSASPTSLLVIQMIIFQFPAIILAPFLMLPFQCSRSSLGTTTVPLNLSSWHFTVYRWCEIDFAFQSENLILGKLFWLHLWTTSIIL